MKYDIKRLLGSNVLVKKTPTATVESSIIVIPDIAVNYDKTVCEVVMVGPGEILNNGEREKMPISPGDKAVSWAGYGCAVGDDYYILDISEIEMKIEDAD